MAFDKTASAVVADPQYSVGAWYDHYGAKRGGRGFTKVAASVPTSKYLLSHCCIMSSVMTEPDPHDYLIKPECSHLVNNNDDGWTNEVLELCYPSFRGAFNFVEHYQNSKASKGHIIDAVLRRVNITSNVWVYFCDILVATDLKHVDIVDKIKAGQIKYMSMGCVTDVVVCSYCGHVVTDDNQPCFHLVFHKGQFMPDDDGVPRRVAELCGHKSLPNGGVKFVEASWVETPAFPGAVKRSVVSEQWEGPAPVGGITASEKVAAVKKNELLRHFSEPHAAADLRRRLR